MAKDLEDRVRDHLRRLMQDQGFREFIVWLFDLGGLNDTMDWQTGADRTDELRAHIARRDLVWEVQGLLERASPDMLALLEHEDRVRRGVYGKPAKAEGTSNEMTDGAAGDGDVEEEHHGG